MTLEWKDNEPPQPKQAATTIKAAYNLGKRPDGKFVLFISATEQPRFLGVFESEEEAIKTAEADHAERIKGK